VWQLSVHGWKSGSKQCGGRQETAAPTVNQRQASTVVWQRVYRSRLAFEDAMNQRIVAAGRVAAHLNFIIVKLPRWRKTHPRFISTQKVRYKMIELQCFNFAFLMKHISLFTFINYHASI
jgi:hypothetical protein